MYVLVLVACMTLSGDTHCQRFEREHAFKTRERCQTAAAIERGRYAERRSRRASWLNYIWECKIMRVS